VLTFDGVIGDGEYGGDDDDDDDAAGEGGGGVPGELQRRGGVANRARQGRLRSSTSSSASSSSSSSAPTIPIGSGCVAQVYKARLTAHHGLHPPGTSVAVKVQHPRILEKVCLDFYILNKIASFLEYIPYLNLDYLSVKDSVDQFRDIMLPQLDLRVEAHNLRRFRRDFEGETRIAFPEPLMGLTSREVLVERFVEGEPMLNYVLKEDENHSRKDREELATIGLETVMKMIFLHDFVHADLVSVCVCVRGGGRSVSLVSAHIASTHSVLRLVFPFRHISFLRSASFRFWLPDSIRAT
jgi:aarF domain-containing kinase